MDVRTFLFWLRNGGKTPYGSPKPVGDRPYTVRLCPPTHIRGDETIMLATIGTIPEKDFLLYQYLTEHLGKIAFSALAFHYFQPDIESHNHVLLAIGEMSKRPTLITDELAAHPFYTRGFVLHEENKIPYLIARAYAHENAARHLIVKGKINFSGKL
jgi:ADP-dependent NAD(P)H-hydrate dehydratase / NAD(P)H-hydrate epimerase